jgi:quercetin dioxygenase-like cupin family protein
MITVARAQIAGPSVQVKNTFTGVVWRDGVLAKSDGVGVANVHFAPGARSFWHAHDGGQLLLIVAGQGIVADDDEAVLVGTGDTVWTPPGVRHWHGASGERYLVHTSISLRGTTWYDAVTDEEYRRAH